MSLKCWAHLSVGCGQMHVADVSIQIIFLPIVLDCSKEGAVGCCVCVCMSVCVHSVYVCMYKRGKKGQKNKTIARIG